MARPSQAGNSRMIGVAIGHVLFTAAIVCFAGALALAPAAPVMPDAPMARWIGAGIFFLFALPAGIYALSPRLLGGPVGWYLGLAVRGGRDPRVFALINAWLGLGFALLFWSAAALHDLHTPGQIGELAIIGGLGATILPPFLAGWILRRRQRRRQRTMPPR